MMMDAVTTLESEVGRRQRVDPAALAAACNALQSVLGNRLRSGRSEREQHAHTTTWIESQLPDAVAFAESADEVVAIVRVCREHRVPIVPFGAGTSLEGHVNAPYGGISIDMNGMNRLIDINAEDFDCIVEPGLTRKQLNAGLRGTGLFFPVDPGADASIGGMAATRASGTNAVRYGTMKDNVLSLKAVMSDGCLISSGGRARKTSAGYDLTRLMIGAEGTLGIITELTLKLHGIPEAISAARCVFPTIECACEAVIETIQTGIPVARVELLDALTVQAVNAYSKLDLPVSPMLLTEFHGSVESVEEQSRSCESIMTEHAGSGFTWTLDSEGRNALWQARHDAFWASLRLRPEARGLATDACVPISALASSVETSRKKAEELGFIAPIVGHVGDGNYHVLLLVDTGSAEEVAKAEHYVQWLADHAMSVGGTCTGEHGIGQGKMHCIGEELGEATQVMLAIKRALDPADIMNPGKILAR